MPNLKVKKLEWYMPKWVKDQDRDLKEVPDGFPLVGRDGYYCRGDEVWFEYQGRGYQTKTGPKEREYFCYTLTVNDEAILMSREVEAIETVLATSRDATVKKALWARLNLHNEAFDLRNHIRQAQKQWLRIKKKRIANGLPIL
jgi:hypothetical protein